MPRLMWPCYANELLECVVQPVHGPPGTGKTSLIKAIAHRTGRNVVSIPLTKVQTSVERCFFA